MQSVRRIQASFEQAQPHARDDVHGVTLAFRPLHVRLDVDRIETFAEIGPELTIPAVAGLGQVLRILRAARIASPRSPRELVGQGERVRALLARAEGTRLVLSIRRRSRMSFVAWTDQGIETVENVADVVERTHDYLVHRSGSRAPLRIPRARVTRGQKRSERWYEVLGIERLAGPG